MMIKILEPTGFIVTPMIAPTGPEGHKKALYISVIMDGETQFVMVICECCFEQFKGTLKNIGDFEEWIKYDKLPPGFKPAYKNVEEDEKKKTEGIYR